jgi:hypothetical protein
VTATKPRETSPTLTPRRRRRAAFCAAAAAAPVRPPVPPLTRQKSLPSLPPSLAPFPSLPGQWSKLWPLLPCPPSGPPPPPPLRSPPTLFLRRATDLLDPSFGGDAWPSSLRCPDVSVGAGASGEHSLPQYHPPPLAPGGHDTRRSNAIRARRQSTHGVAHPSEPSVLTRRTVTSGPSLRRTQATTPRLGTPWRLAAAVQVARSL